MTYTTYVDGDGLKKNRKVRGTGTQADPYDSYTYDVDLNTAAGTRTQAPADKPTLTTTGTTSYSIIQLLKSILLNTGESSGGGSTAFYSTPVNVASVSVTTTVATVAEVITADWDYLTLWIQNTGSVALNEFKTEAGMSATLEFKYAFLAGAAAAGSYSTGTGKQSGNSLIPVITANNLPALAASGDAFIELDVRRYQRIRFQASVASGTTNLVLNGILTR